MFIAFKVCINSILSIFVKCVVSDLLYLVDIMFGYSGISYHFDSASFCAFLGCLGCENKFYHIIFFPLVSAFSVFNVAASKNNKKCVSDVFQKYSKTTFVMSGIHFMHVCRFVLSKYPFNLHICRIFYKKMIARCCTYKKDVILLS